MSGLVFHEFRLGIPGKGEILVRGCVTPGERVVIQGASGCGKTTFLRAAAGLVRPISGHCSLDEKKLTGLAPQETGAGLVFQSGALFPHMSVLENVVFGLKYRDSTRDWSDELRRNRAREFLNHVGLNDFESRAVSALSGGEKQRVALVRALVCEPEYLLLDEPLSSVDPDRREETQRWILALLAERPVPAIIVTHDLGEADRLGSRRVVWEEGLECLEF